MSLQIIDGKGASSMFDTPIRCHRIQMLGKEDTTMQKLFAGYDTLCVITFSYSVGFLEELFRQFSFSHVKIILGGEWLVQKDAKMHRVLAEAMAYADDSVEQILQYERLVRMLHNGSLEVRCTRALLEHRKYYLLSNNSSTRVITASANLSRAAWTGDNMEFYEVDDSALAYNECLAEFETGWVMSEPIPQEVCPLTEQERVQNNILVSKTINLDTMVVMPAMTELVAGQRNKIPYFTKHEERADWYEDTMTGVLPRVKKNAIELTAKHVEKMVNKEKIQARKGKRELSVGKYPKMTFMYGSECGAYLNGQSIDLHPSSDAVRHDIDILFDVFQHFENDFVEGSIGGLCHNHWKFLVYGLVSPFVAKMRCLCDIYGISTECMPLYALLVSHSADTGKTFMTQVLQHLICEKEFQPCLLAKGNDKDTGVDWVRGVHNNAAGVPFLIDEVNSHKFGTSFRDILKGADSCEINGRESQPMICITSNDIVSPDRVICKRSVFLLFDGTLRYGIDRSGYRSQGKRILSKFSTNFYREYLRRILPKMSDLMDYIQNNEDRPDTWYPDIVKVSSDVLFSILKDYGYHPRDYMTPLEWNRDYGSLEVSFLVSIREMQSVYTNFPDMFSVESNRIVIHSDSKGSYEKKFNSWKNTIPAEAQPDVSCMRDSITFSADLSVLQLLGFKYSKSESPASKKFFGFLKKRGV